MAGPEYQIAALWMEGKLSFLEQLCLKSFVDAGHHVKLYHYGPLENVPDGMELANAEEVLESNAPINQIIYKGCDLELPLTPPKPPCHDDENSCEFQSAQQHCNRANPFGAVAERFKCPGRSNNWPQPWTDIRNAGRSA